MSRRFTPPHSPFRWSLAAIVVILVAKLRIRDLERRNAKLVYEIERLQVKIAELESQQSRSE